MAVDSDAIQCYTEDVGKKRNVIPIDFPEELMKLLQAEAGKRGLPTSTYIRSLIFTHPEIQSVRKTKSK